MTVTMAMAIQTAMHSAEPAGLHQPFVELLAGTVETDFEVVAGDAQISGDSFQSAFAQIHRFDGLRVFGFQSEQQLTQATADVRFFLLVGHSLEVFRHLYEHTLANTVATVKIKNRPPEDAIEPRHDTLAFAELTGILDRFEQAVLHGVCGEVGVGHAFAGKREEHFVMRQQLGRQRVAFGVRPGCFVRGCHGFRVYCIRTPGSMTGLAVLLELPVVVGQRREKARDQGDGQRGPVKRVVH